MYQNIALVVLFSFGLELQAHWLRFDVRLIRSIYSIIEHRHTHQQPNRWFHIAKRLHILDGIADVMNGRNGGTHTQETNRQFIAFALNAD